MAGKGLEWSRGNYHLSARYQWAQNGPKSAYPELSPEPFVWLFFQFPGKRVPTPFRSISPIKTLSPTPASSSQSLSDRVDDHINGLAHDI